MSSTEPATKQTQGRSLRISLIPISVTASDFRAFLEKLPSRHQSEDGDTNILALSLVKDNNSQVSTVCFKSEPDLFLECAPHKEIYVAFDHHGTKHQLVIDCDFFGLTPLYSSEKPGVE